MLKKDNIETIKVKDIFDIPDIENLLDNRFVFCTFDKADNTVCYDYVDNEMFYDVVIICNENIFLGLERFSDLITFEDIQYFSLRIESVNSFDMYTKIYKYIKPKD